MTRINVSREVDARADAVWRIVTDVENSAEVVSAISKIERLDDNEGFGLGTRWRETRTMFGKEATEEMAVTAVDPGRSYTIEADGRGAHYVSVVKVEPIDEKRSNLSMSFGGEPQGIGSKVLAATVGKLFEGATRKGLQSDLDDIARAAEQGA